METNVETNVETKSETNLHIKPQTSALILAAGRGSRMQQLTDHKPKCLLDLDGKSLLSWQLQALHSAGLTHISVLTGYKQELLQGDFEKIHNKRWESTNMVQSLLCGLPHFENKNLIVSYSDIVYTPSHVQALMKKSADIAICYDTEWQKLWSLRNENPLDDAETFCEQNGQLLEIGGKPKTLKDVQGQYMGLLKFSPKGRQIVLDITSKMDAQTLNKLDMTSLLRKLLAANVTIYTVPVKGAWCECDTEKDIDLYEQQLLTKDWSHDWR